jgi:hypothetical protein
VFIVKTTEHTKIKKKKKKTFFYLYGKQKRVGPLSALSFLPLLLIEM